ncbi:NAD(P)/FAD-dependent oxidoreductase [Pyxidicoccus fallax]|uniref:Pyridine nucleotide-disulfide oxidoreductase domain-containing protein 2 n=1 Tax=Pyxidicoccus fallax TaxID=394095 RepID=A0A848LSM5_9BACT|nr:NAD(P)/FAD-dependent oxidoreductase [Pyxidicoccus fallax]NMO20632.1 NAD(P)/FAD-dependent oxidoreductase [Pyxidicoccus fallax]NPC83670.1 NAD(P)/FAD-dependent oxidoreductase [Pyxidicoccus fallax]
MPDVIVVGAGHNGLVTAALLARRGLSVTVLEEKDVLGGACRTEHPFRAAPGLGVSTGAYLLGLMPPELLRELELDLPLKRRDPHYFLPTTGQRYLLFGSDERELKRQFLEFFSQADWEAHQAMNAELAALREDLAPAWLKPPLSVEETAERYIRPALRQHFVRLCRGTAREYLERFGYKSDLVKAMYAVTDAFSGLDGGYDTPGTGMNLLVHNMCRLPGSGGTWMIVGGGMGTVTQRIADVARKYGATLRTGAKVTSVRVDRGVVKGVVLENGEEVKASVVVSNGDPFRTLKLVDASALPEDYRAKVAAMAAPGTTMKVNLCLKGLPTFTCLPQDRGQFGPTIHLLPQEDDVLGALARGYQDTREGRLSEFPSIEWYIHTTVDPSLRDAEGHHNSALFVQWVPYALKGTTWEQEESRYVKHLLSICDRFAPGTSDLVRETFTLTPPKIEKYFGITHGHIHHVDNKLGFTDRLPYETPVQGLYFCSAGCHPAGSVIGAAGHNAANVVLQALGR